MGCKTMMGGGIGGIIIVLLFTLLGGNPGYIINNDITTDSNTNAPHKESAQEKELADFVSVVLADTEDVRSSEFKKRGLTYENPKLVLYTDSVQSACGSAISAVGPFYCPGDHKLYIDLSLPPREL